MNKIKIYRNIKDTHKKNTEKDYSLNYRLTTNDLTHQTTSSYGISNNHSYFKPRNPRQSSSKPKMKTETHKRTKSAIKLTKATPQPKPQNDQLKNDPLYSQIKSLWSMLGVTSSYKNIFDNVSLQLVPIYREGYYNYEIKQLMNLSTLINKTNKDIESREKIIQLIKKFDEYIKLEENSQNTTSIPFDKLIADITKTLGDLRAISLSIVNSYTKIRKEISYDVLMNKHDLDNIVNFNRQYLLQMKNDTDFLSKTSLKKYFTFANESDPFLTSIAISSVESNKYSLPIDSTMIENIKDCQYIMLQEMIYNECNKLSSSKVESTLSSYSIKSINSAKKITFNNNYVKKSTFDIDSIINEYKRDGKSLSQYENKLKKMNTNTSKKELKPIKTMKSPDYMKKKVLNDSMKYTAHNTEVKTPKKLSMNASNSEALIFEDSKTQEKKGKYNSRSPQYRSRPYKTEIDCLEDSDLIKIDEIINRSIKQKIEIDKKKENNKEDELSALIIKDQNKYAKEQYIVSKEDSTDDVTRIKNQIEQQQLKQIHHTPDIPEELNDSIPDEITKVPITIEKPIQEMKEEKHQFTFSIYSGNISELTNLYKEYYKNIPEEQHITFNINEDILSYFRGIYPQVVLSRDMNQKINSIIIFSIDLSQEAKNLLISNISCLSNEHFGDMINQFIDYCNTSIPYEEITVEYYYGVKDGSFYMNKQLETAVKKEAKFKWINMENDGMIRKIKYKYRKVALTARNLNNDIFSKKSLNVISIQSGTFLSLDSIIDEFEEDIFIGTVMEKNDFNLLCFIVELIYRFGYKISIDDPNSNSLLCFLNSLPMDKFRKLTKEIIKVSLGSTEQMAAFVNANINEIASLINTEIKESSMIGSSVMKVECSFENIIKTELNGYEYNIIINNIEVCELKEKEQKYYLLHTTNENISFLIYEFKEGEVGAFNKVLNEDNEEVNITEAFKKIYNKIDQESSVKKKKIYLPSFNIERSEVFNNPSLFNKLRLCKGNNDYDVNLLNIVEKVNFGYNGSNEGRITFSNDIEESIIISNDFFISVINSDLLLDAQIPTVSAYIVTKDNWIKYSI